MREREREPFYLEEIRLLDLKNGKAGVEEDADVLEAQESRRLGALIHRPHVHRAGIQRRRNVTEKDLMNKEGSLLCGL